MESSKHSFTIPLYLHDCSNQRKTPKVTSANGRNWRQWLQWSFLSRQINTRSVQAHPWSCQNHQRCSWGEPKIYFFHLILLQKKKFNLLQKIVWIHFFFLHGHANFVLFLNYTLHSFWVHYFEHRNWQYKHQYLM